MGECFFCGNKWFDWSQSDDNTCQVCHESHENIWILETNYVYNESFVTEQRESDKKDSYFIVNSLGEKILVQSPDWSLGSDTDTDPEHITNLYNMCCDSPEELCLCSAQLVMSWKEVLIDTLLLDGVRMDQLYHPDTLTTCAGCKYYATVQCKPLRNMLWTKAQGWDKYRSIVPCVYYAHYKQPDRYRSEKKVKVNILQRGDDFYGD